MKNKRIFKSLFIFLLVISTFILSGIFINNQYFEKNVVEANSVSDAFNIMGKNNPINKALAKEIKDIEDREQAKLELERLKEIERLKEVERLAEIERIAREKAKKEEFDKNRKIAYLTFDDGPSSQSTDAILDILGEYNIKATFFVVGKMVVNYPEVLQRTLEEGHAIGNHSYSHDYGYIYHSGKNFMRDINLADEAIKNALG